MNNLKPGVNFILEGAPYVVLESHHLKVAQRRPVMQTKIKNLITGNVQNRNFAQSDSFQEAEIERKPIKFIYSHRGKYFFSEQKNPSKRFDLDENLIGEQKIYLKPDSQVEAIYFNDKIINIALPVKIKLRVTEAPPNIKGNTAQGGTKTAILESGAKVQVPLFVKTGDEIIVNTQTGFYASRDN